MSHYVIQALLEGNIVYHRETPVRAGVENLINEGVSQLFSVSGGNPGRDAIVEVLRYYDEDPVPEVELVVFADSHEELFFEAEALTKAKGKVRTMSGKPHTPRKLKQDSGISPEEAARRIALKSESKIFYADTMEWDIDYLESYETPYGTKLDGVLYNPTTGESAEFEGITIETSIPDIDPLYANMEDIPTYEAENEDNLGPMFMAEEKKNCGCGQDPCKTYGAEEDERVVCFICNLTPEESDGEYGPMMSTLGGDACKDCAEEYGYRHPRDMIYLDADTYISKKMREKHFGPRVPNWKKMDELRTAWENPSDYFTPRMEDAYYEYVENTYGLEGMDDLPWGDFEKFVEMFSQAPYFASLREKKTVALPKSAETFEAPKTMTKTQAKNKFIALAQPYWIKELTKLKEGFIQQKKVDEKENGESEYFEQYDYDIEDTNTYLKIAKSNSKIKNIIGCDDGDTVVREMIPDGFYYLINYPREDYDTWETTMAYFEGPKTIKKQLKALLPFIEGKVTAKPKAKAKKPKYYLHFGEDFTADKDVYTGKKFAMTTIRSAKALANHMFNFGPMPNMTPGYADFTINGEHYGNIVTWETEIIDANTGRVVDYWTPTKEQKATYRKKGNAIKKAAKPKAKKTTTRKSKPKPKAKAKTGRKAPTISATKRKIGTRMRGNDGNMWQVKKSGKSQRWMAGAETQTQTFHSSIDSIFDELL